MSLGVNVMLKDGSRGDTEDFANNRGGRASLRQSMQTIMGSADRGNPLRVMFRDPPALAELPRPIISGEGCGLIQYTREMAVGAALPGQDGGSVPTGILDLINMLPPAHDFQGPTPNVEQVIDSLRAVELPAPPAEDDLPSSRMAPQQMQQFGSAPGAHSAAPSASDIFRMRQMLKQQKK